MNQKEFSRRNGLTACKLRQQQVLTLSQLYHVDKKYPCLVGIAAGIFIEIRHKIPLNDLEAPM